MQAVGEVKGLELDLGLQRLERGGQDDSESEEKVLHGVNFTRFRRYNDLVARAARNLTGTGFCKIEASIFGGGDFFTYLCNP